MSYPPQTIISSPVQTDVCKALPAGALTTLVASQALVLGLYLPPVLTELKRSPPPDDHFTPCPDCRMRDSASGCVSHACSFPTVGVRVISAAAVEVCGKAVITAPNDHFTASPDRRRRLAASRRVSGASRYPMVRAGVVFAAGVEVVKSICSCPND